MVSCSKIYHKIWNKVSNILNKRFDNKPVYDKKYLKTKIKSYEEKINTNFHVDGMPEEGSPYACLSVILINSVVKLGKNYYPQAFLEECKSIFKKIIRRVSVLVMA